jgi:DNA repair photolyase
MTTGAREWSEVSKNCIKGCSNDCKYCYGKKWANRWGRIPKENWHAMEYNPNSVKYIKKERGKIMFPTTHDLHIEHAGWWMPFLTGLLEKGNDVLIVSKPRVNAINLICQSFQKNKKQIEFRFTIGTDDDVTRKFWEPNAPPIQERIQALKLAYDAGYKTSVSMEPVLTHTPENLIKKISPYVTDTIWIGKMNYLSDKWFNENTIKWYYEMKSINSYDNMKKVYENNKGNPKIRWKDSVRKLLTL